MYCLNRIAPVCLSLVVAFTTTSAWGQDEPKPEKPPTLPVQGLIPIDVPMVIVVRPATMLKVPSFKQIHDQFAGNDGAKDALTLLDLESIDEITLVLLRRDLRPGTNMNKELAEAVAIVVKTNKPREWKALAAAVNAPVEKATHDGKEYFKLKENGTPMVGFYQIDEKTVVFSAISNLLPMIERTKGPDDVNLPKIAGIQPSSVFAMSLDFDWFRDVTKPVLKESNRPGASLMALSVIKPIWEKTTYATIKVDIAKDELVTISAENICKDETGGKEVQQTVDALLTLGRNSAPEFVKLARAEAENNPVIALWAELGEQALATSKVSRDDTRVTFSTSFKLDMQKLKKFIGLN